MLEIKKIGKCTSDVYDISLDGTVVNALGMNVLSNTDGFNFKLPDDDKYRYTEEHPYISTGESRETEKDKKYVGFRADLAEFNDKYMKDFHYSPNGINKMGCGLDEVVDSTINFSRKNYCDYFPDEPFPSDVKMVGNTIKSKKMPEYIAKFLAVAVRLLLKNDGIGFLNEYYNYIEKIYNYKIPLRDIATKGKVKKSIEEYKEDCKTLTKAGRPKSRQAWYELAILNNLNISNGDVIYYINTGKSKSHADVKKVTHYFNIVNGEKKEITKDIDKEYKIYKKEIKDKDKLLEKSKWIVETYPNHIVEEELIMNCVLVPTEVIESNQDTFCDENMEYNTAKYIDMFNKRITPLLVCFNRDIREKILINNPNDRQFFTDNEAQLCSGQPNKVGDQDTYEALMTMEDKEIRFWIKYNMVPPFLKECQMGEWENIVKDYNERMEKERKLGIDKEREAYNSLLNKLTKDEIFDFIENGTIPPAFLKIVDYNPVNGTFVSKIQNDVKIGELYDISELLDRIDNEDAFEDEEVTLS